MLSRTRAARHTGRGARLLADDHRHADDHSIEKVDRVPVVHADAAVGGVGADRAVFARRYAVQADARCARTHPAGADGVLGAGRDGLCVLGPIGGGRQPGGILDHRDDRVGAGGGRPGGLARRHRVALHELAVAVQVETEVADVDDDLAAESGEHVAADDAVDLEAVVGLELPHGQLRLGVVDARLGAGEDAGVGELRLQLLDVFAAGARPQGGGAEVLGAVDDERLLVGDDVAALVAGRDDHRVLALGEVLDREHGARRQAFVLARLAVEHQLELGFAELIAGLDADLEARVSDGLVQLRRLERGGEGVDEDAQLLGGRVARHVGGGDGDVRGPVGQVGAHRVLAACVGLAAGLDTAPRDRDRGVRFGGAAERRRRGVDAAFVGRAGELERGDAGVDREAPVLADLVTEQVGAGRDERDRVGAVGQLAGGEGELVAAARGLARDVVAVERDAKALELGQALDVRIWTRRDRRDARDGEHLPGGQCRQHANRRDDVVRPAAVAAAFAPVDTVCGLRHYSSSKTISLRLYLGYRYSPRSVSYTHLTLPTKRI